MISLVCLPPSTVALPLASATTIRHLCRLRTLSSRREMLRPSRHLGRLSKEFSALAEVPVPTAEELGLPGLAVSTLIPLSRRLGLTLMTRLPPEVEEALPSLLANFLLLVLSKIEGPAAPRSPLVLGVCLRLLAPPPIVPLARVCRRRHPPVVRPPLTPVAQSLTLLPTDPRPPRIGPTMEVTPRLMVLTPWQAPQSSLKSNLT